MNFRSVGTVELAFDGKICADMMGRNVAKAHSSQKTASKKLMAKMGQAIGRSEGGGSKRQIRKTGTNPMRGCEAHHIDIFDSGRVKQELGNHDVDQCEQHQSCDYNEMRASIFGDAYSRSEESQGGGRKQQEIMHYYCIETTVCCCLLGVGWMTAD